MAEQRIPPQVLFTNFIHKMEIEISSACNRRCDYCPQSIVRRKQALMPLPLFKKIILDLKSLGYQRELAFHQYNEPLLVPEHLLACDTIVQTHLPGVRKVLHTNGDALSGEMLAELVERGFSLIIVTLHLNPGEAWSTKGSIQKIKEFSDRIQVLDIEGIDTMEPTPDTPVSLTANFGKTTLHITTPNFFETGANRVGSVPVKSPKEIRLCPNLLHQMNIAYEGTSYLCCDCCHGLQTHEAYAVGSIHDMSVLQLFEHRYKTYTKDYLFGNLPKPCVICMGG